MMSPPAESLSELVIHALDSGCSKCSQDPSQATWMLVNAGGRLNLRDPLGLTVRGLRTLTL